MSFKEYLQRKIGATTDDIVQGMIAKVVAFDGAKMRADVQPLYQSEGQDRDYDYPVIPGVAVGFLYGGGYYIKPVYEAGDLVWIAFSSHDVENALAEKTRPTSSKMFELENAVVAFGIAKTDWTPPTGFSKAGLLIGYRDGKVQIQADAAKLTLAGDAATKIEVEAGSIKLTAGATVVTIDASGLSQAVGGARTTLGQHLHIGAAPGSPTAPPTPGT